MKVSILSPILNEETFLPEMISSIRNQDHQDWELLFVDDGSSDKSVAIMRAAAESDSRIKLVGFGRNLGQAAAFNQAFLAATGHAVALLGGDDRMPPNSLARRVEGLRTARAPLTSAVYAKLRMFWEDGSQPSLILPRGSRGSGLGADILMGSNLAHEVFPIPEGVVSDDPWVALACRHLASEIVHVPVVAVDYRIHGGNSHPRNKSFKEMNETTHAMAYAHLALLEAKSKLLSSQAQKQLVASVRAEEHRYSGRTVAVLRETGLPMTERLSLALASSSSLYALRMGLFRCLSGWRNSG